MPLAVTLELSQTTEAGLIKSFAFESSEHLMECLLRGRHLGGTQHGLEEGYGVVELPARHMAGQRQVVRDQRRGLHEQHVHPKDAFIRMMGSNNYRTILMESNNSRNPSIFSLV